MTTLGFMNRRAALARLARLGPAGAALAGALAGGAAGQAMARATAGATPAAGLLPAPALPVGAGAAAPGGPGGPGDILLGQSASFSGAFATQAASYRDGALACLAEANARGGVAGRAVRLVSLDDSYQVERALANGRQLVQQSQVIALFNCTWTNTVQALLPLAADHGVPLISPYTGTEALYARHWPQLFTTRASFADELAHIVRHWRTVGYTRVGLLHYDSASGRELRADLQRRLAEAGLALAAEGRMATGSRDATAAVAALQGAELQALLVGASGSDAVAFLRRFEAARPGRTRHYARSLVGLRQLVDELGPLATGVSVSQTAPNPHRHRATVAVDYRRLLRALNPAFQPDHIGLEGFIAARVLLRALALAGPQPGRESLRRAYQRLGRIDIGGYALHFDEQRHHGSRFVDITMIGHDRRVID